MLRKFSISAGRILLPLLVVSNVAFCDTVKIYENLVQCYRGNNTQPFIGNSLQILLELIRKIENKHPTALDIRILSVSLLHRLRIDGIERAPGIHETDFITPYRPNGIMIPKFELLLKLISDVPAETIKFDNVLTAFELCTLHKLISSSVEPFKRGDEPTTCLNVNDKNENSNLNDFIQSTKVKVFQNKQTYVIPGSISKCPMEMGVIRSLQYGSFAPGVLIASIAAGLQPQLVPIKDFFPSIKLKSDPYENLETMQKYDTDRIIRKLSQSFDAIDNIYAAGLAGDLAEVCIYQAPYYKENVTIGLKGYWNDTDYPLIRYLPESYQLEWAMTDSEILAGIDSFHLSTHIRSWVNRIRRMRLSQIIEMYYSPRGIPMFSVENSNRSKRPINYYDSYQQDDDELLQHQQYPSRMQNYYQRKRPGTADLTSQLYGVPDDYSGLYRGNHYDPTDRYTIGDKIDSACERKQILNRISKERLKEQTYFLAQVLQYSTKTMTIDDALIKSVCDSSVDKFFDYANNLLNNLPDCNKIGSNYLRPTVDLTLIIDGSRTRYENLKLISFLSEILDVSCYGSKISVVHGTTGEYMVTTTDSIANAFEQLRNYRDPYPTTLSLTESFTTILNTLNGFNNDEKHRNGKIIGNSKVILVMSQSQKIRENDFTGAKRMIEGSFQAFGDLYFVFLTNDVKMFMDMTKNVAESSVDSKTHYNVIEASNIDPQTFSSSLTHTLRSIPKWMRIPDCNEMKPLNTRNPGDPIDTATEYQNRFEHEEYISPNEKIFYKINGKQFSSENNADKTEELQIQFQSVDYGDITVCMTKNSKDYQCQSTTVMDPIQFNVTQLCDQQQQKTNLVASPDRNTDSNVADPVDEKSMKSCSSLTFKIDMDSSKVKCSENDCRYPDQVRFLVRLRNMQCKNTATNLVISSVVFSIALFNYYYYNFVIKFTIS